LTATGNSLFTHQLATQTGADHASVDSMILVRGYTDFVTALHVALDPAGAGDFAQPPAPRDLGTAVLPPIDPAWSAAKQARAARLAATQTWLTTGGLETPVKYGRGLDGIFLGFSEKLASDLKLISGVKHGVNAAAKEGITVLHFTYTNTYLRDLNAADPSIGGFLGVAIDVADGSRSKCAFLFFVPMLDTFVHEIGHHLFMPHAPNAGGFVADRHDDADANCMMSYNRPRLAFCGLCQLRLRGWSALALKKTAAQNKKP